MEVAAGSNKHPGKSENMMSATQSGWSSNAVVSPGKSEHLLKVCGCDDTGVTA